MFSSRHITAGLLALGFAADPAFAAALPRTRSPPAAAPLASGGAAAASRNSGSGAALETST